MVDRKFKQRTDIMIKKIVFIIFILLFVVNISFVYAERRTALVIGNSSYKSTPLKNSVNDARDIAAMLRACGEEYLGRWKMLVTI